MVIKALKMNFAINVLGALIPLAVALVTVPIYINHIGAARYGVLSIVWVLLGYFGFLDLGLSRAAANALAKLRDATQPERARVLVTTIILNLGLGLVGSIALALAGSYLLQHVLAVPDALKPEIAVAFPWIVGLFPLALISGVGIGALESREKFLLANALQVSGMSLGQIVPVILAVIVSPSLAVVIPAAAVARALTVIAILIVVYREEGPLRLSAFDQAQAGRLFRYGGWVTVSSVTGPLLISLDQFVIASVLGVAAVAHYAVPMNLVMRSQFLPSALTRTLFPRLSQIDTAEAQNLAARAFNCICFGYTVSCAPAIILAPSFFYYWLSPDFALAAAPVAALLFFGVWLNSLAFVPYELLQSKGRPDLTAKFHVVELVPFVITLWVSTSLFGILGAAAAWTLRCGVDTAFLFFAARMPTRSLTKITLPIAVMICSAIVAHSCGPNPIKSATMAFLFFLLALALAFYMDRDIKKLVLTLLSTSIGILNYTYRLRHQIPFRRS